MAATGGNGIAVAGPIARSAVPLPCAGAAAEGRATRRGATAVVDRRPHRCLNIGARSCWCSSASPRSRRSPLDVVTDQRRRPLDAIDLSGQTAFDLEHAAIPCEVVTRRAAHQGRGADLPGAGRHRGVRRRPRRGRAASSPAKRVWFSVAAVDVPAHRLAAPRREHALPAGSSATTSRTTWAGPGTCSSTCSAGSWPRCAHVLVQPDERRARSSARPGPSPRSWAPTSCGSRRRRSCPCSSSSPSGCRPRFWLLFWFVLQFFTGPDDGVAWVAHVGGVRVRRDHGPARRA